MTISTMSWLRRGGLGLVLLGALVIPFFFNSSFVLDVARGWATSLAIVGLVLLTGFTKQVSIGQNLFYAIGGYLAARAVIGIDNPVIRTLLVLVLAAVVSAALAYVLGSLILRIRGIYLALITFGLGLATPALALRFDAFTGGAMGTSVPALFPREWLGLQADQLTYIATLLLLIGGMAWALRIEASPLGAAMKAVGDNELVAEAGGIHVGRVKSIAFSIAAAYAAVAGVVLGAIAGFIAPGSVEAHVALTLIAGLVIAGYRSILFAPLGGLFVIFAPIRLEQINESMSGVLFGLAIVLLMVFLPGGLASIVERLKRRVGL